MGGDEVEGDVEAGAERLEVGGVGLVVDILHADMDGLDGEAGLEDAGTAGKELQEA